MRRSVNFEKVKEKLYETFDDRLKAVIEETEGIGWGFHDGLCDSYYSLKWIEEE